MKPRKSIMNFEEESDHEENNEDIFSDEED